MKGNPTPTSIILFNGCQLTPLAYVKLHVQPVNRILHLVIGNFLEEPHRNVNHICTAPPHSQGYKYSALTESSVRALENTFLTTTHIDLYSLMLRGKGQTVSQIETLQQGLMNIYLICMKRFYSKRIGSTLYVLHTEKYFTMNDKNFKFIVCFLVFFTFSFVNNEALASNKTVGPQPTENSHIDVTQSTKPVNPKTHSESKEITELTSLINSQKVEIEVMRDKISSLENSSGMNFAVWTGILLASVAVILTVLGIAMAVFSFFGYKKIMDSVKEVATTISTTEAAIVSERLAPTVTEGVLLKLIEGRSFDKIIFEAVQKVTYRGIRLSSEDMLEEEPK